MLPVPHPVWYCTLVEMAMAPTVEHVRPVVRPLFATLRPTLAAAPIPACGGPGSGTFPVTVLPSKKIVPFVSTAPGLISAMAASTFAPGVSSLANWDKCATIEVPLGLQLLFDQPWLDDVVSQCCR